MSMLVQADTEIALEFRQYICQACGLIYDEAKGDPDSGLAAGTRFEQIPEDWSCPLCGVTKSDFEPYVAQAISRAPSTQPVTTPGKRSDQGVVIVGAGTAGWTIAQTLRQLDAAVPITMVTGCAGDVYDKPLLSVAMGKKLALESLVKQPGRETAASLNIRLLAGTHAISIASGASALRTTRGTLRYRHLVLAHGAEPRALDQLPAHLCWRINDLQHYTAFRQALATGQGAQRILIAGAGLVGSELANDLALGGHHVTLLDPNPRPLANLLSKEASDELLAAWRPLPLTFIGGVSIAQVCAEGRVRHIRTQDGQLFSADHVLAATGLQTASRLAQSAGLGWNNGIAVDPISLRTCVSNIHALGDCISIEGKAHRYIEPIARQARVIAAHLVGDTPAPYVNRLPSIRIKTGSRSFTV